VSVSVETIELLVKAGVSGDDLVAILRSIEADMAPTPRTANAERQARHRAKKAAERDQGVTESVTRNVTDNVTSPPPLAPSPPDPPNPTPPRLDITPRAKGLAGKPSGFSRWWEAYPNKVAKQAAERAYATACRKIGGPDPPAILFDGLKRALASGVWDDGFIPHPTTWLNQGRWDDEPAPRTPTRKAHERPDPRQTERNDALRSHLAGAHAALAERGYDMV
jgi:hypothetical protein